MDLVHFDGQSLRCAVCDDDQMFFAMQKRE